MGMLAAGSIDYEEFLAATVNLNHLEKEDTMYNAFRHFDTDNSGYITQTEMEDALSVRANVFAVACLVAWHRHTTFKVSAHDVRSPYVEQMSVPCLLSVLACDALHTYAQYLPYAV